MCTLLTLTGSSVAYIYAIHSIFFRVKTWQESAGIYLFINFGNYATFAIIYAKPVMCTLLTLTGSMWHIFLQYKVFFPWSKSWYESAGIYLFINFGNFATFAIMYAKTVMCTLLALMGSSVAYVSAIHSIFFRVKIVVRVRRYVIIYKIR